MILRRLSRKWRGLIFSKQAGRHLITSCRRQFSTMPQDVCHVATVALPHCHSRSAILPQSLCHVATVALLHCHRRLLHCHRRLLHCHGQSTLLPQQVCLIATVALLQCHSQSATVPQSVCQRCRRGYLNLNFVSVPVRSRLMFSLWRKMRSRTDAVQMTGTQTDS